MNLSSCSKKPVADETRIGVPQALADRLDRMFFPARKKHFLPLRTANLLDKPGDFFERPADFPCKLTDFLDTLSSFLGRLADFFGKPADFFGKLAGFLNKLGLLKRKTGILNGRRAAIFRETPYFSMIYHFFRNDRKEQEGGEKLWLKMKPNTSMPTC